MSNPVGRPSVITEEVVRKLEESFSIGAPDNEACFLAGISRTALYEYCQANPEFADRKEQLKELTKFQARKNVSGAIKAESLNIGLAKPEMSQWYLARKAKSEFSERTENTGKDGAPLVPEIHDVDIEEIAKRVGEEIKKEKMK